MRQAKKGDTVKLKYRGKIEDETEFTFPNDDAPIELTIGDGSMIPGFENAIVGMTSGEKRTITVFPEEGFGHKRQDLIVNVDRVDVPPHIKLTLGKNLIVKTGDEEELTVTVTDINDDIITIDANSPLAGKTVIFDIELLEFI